MHKAYKDYHWKNGKPYGKTLTTDLSGITYRIVVDPYYKRFSLEEHENDHFKRLIYDSALFDFRHLKKPEQAQWLRHPLSEHKNLIRDEVDRLILIESYTFENNLCRLCQITTPHGTPIALQKISYESLGDPFNGVTLYDINETPILKKNYAFDPEKEEFTDLISECWEP